MSKHILQNYSISVDGKGYAGEIGKYTPPDTSLSTEEYRAGGMDAPILREMGMEAMEAKFVFKAYNYDVLALFGVAEGQVVPFVARGALKGIDGSIVPIKHTLRGLVTKMTRPDWEAGKGSEPELTLSIQYFKEEINGKRVIEIDVENMIRFNGDVDILTAVRAALGI